MRREKRPAFDDVDTDDEDAIATHEPGSTAELVARVLEEGQKAKSKSDVPRATVLPSGGGDSDDDAPKDARDGKKVVSFAEDDDEDDAAMARKASGAAKTRALLRSEWAAGVRDADDVDARDDVKDAEEALVGDDEGKESEFMAFNLDKERQEGYFDDDGNYVEYAEEQDEADLWLEKDAKVDERLASGAIKRSTAAFEEEEGATSMSEREVAVVQREIAGYLNPGETVLGALKRLGGNAKKGGGGRGGNQGKPAKVMSDEEKKVFDKLTELSSALMGQGEYEVYTFRKEAFERAANLYAPTTTLTEDTGKDMFADSDDDEGVAPEPSLPAAKKAKVEPSKIEDPPLSSGLNFASMSVKNLKAYIQAHGGSVAGNIAEKSELISRAKCCKPVVVPEGYAWRADDGMYYCQASDLFYDHHKQLFTDKHKYWTYDQENGFVEWTA